MTKEFSFFSDNFKLQCGGKPIQITNGAITLSYYSTSPIARNTTCTVRVFSPISKYPANVIAYFRTFYTDYSQNCVNSRLDIFDSLETTGRAITGTNYKTLNNEALIYLNFSNDNGFFTICSYIKQASNFHNHILIQGNYEFKQAIRFCFFL